MLSKTIKLGWVLITTVVLVAGCASTSEKTDESAQDPNPPAVSQPQVEPSRPTQVQASGGIDNVFYFDFDQATLKPESRAALMVHAERLKSDSRSVRLEGHADERGTREYNMALGERRAIAVRDFLQLQGVDSRIEVISYGEERPADSNSNESAWALNRRVELK